MNYLKRAHLALIFVMAFASAPVCPVATETRITELKNVYVKQGNKVSIAARGQLNKGFGWTDIGEEYLNFTVSDSKGQEIFSKKEKMSFWDGNATINIDTDNLNHGNYTIHIKFAGNKYLRPCKMQASLVVAPRSINFENQNVWCKL